MSSNRALIVGLGIAGMSAAIGLSQAGWTPVLIERSPERRQGGYFIGLFPEGRNAATELGVFDKIHMRTATGPNWEIDRQGHRYRSLTFADQPGGPDSVLRGDIESGLWRSVEEHGVEVRFATKPVSIGDAGDGVRVVLEDGQGAQTKETFDLVIGADGLRSTVRSLVFGPHEQFMHSLDSIICAFQFTDQVPLFNERDGVTLVETGRALWVFPFADRAPTALFTYRTKDVDAQFRLPPLEALRAAYAGTTDSLAVSYALEQFEKSTDYLFDSVHRIEMDSWHRGRVLLIGDAAWCMTLYSGMGASSGLYGASVLGKMLRRHPDDIERALTEWEAELRPFIRTNTRLARLKQQLFVPSNPLVRLLRGTALFAAGRRVGATTSRAAAGELRTSA